MRHIYLNMKNFVKVFFFNLLLLVIIYSCSKDPSDAIETVPAEPIASQYAIENDSIIDFLQTHFYNYEDFVKLSSNETTELIIDTISGDNADKIPLFNQVTAMAIDIVDENDDIVPHNLYYVINRNGNGANPTVADSVFVSYKGMTLNKNTFDSRKLPTWLDQTSVVRGFQEFTALLKRGDINVNSNGTYSFENFGIGFVIMPSGLGYYNRASVTIPAYSPLIFQINLNTLNTTDHDGDGVNSINEDLDGNHIFRDDDTDSDNTPNYLDPDDDGDGILTKDEYDTDSNGVPDDTDGDGTPDYLDND